MNMLMLIRMDSALLMIECRSSTANEMFVLEKMLEDIGFADWSGADK